MKERLLKASMRYYLGRYLYKKPGQDDYMSLEKVEDLLYGFKQMLAYMVEDIAHKGRLNEAKGVCDRHEGIFDYLREDIKEKLEDVVYDPSKDPEKYDVFGPITTETQCIKLPDHVSVEWISKEEDIVKLDQLLTEQYIGVDSEWRPSMAKFHKTYPAIFQISGGKTAFLIDFVSLKNSDQLDNKLSEVF